MTVTLDLLGRQMQRVLSELQALRGVVDITRSAQLRIADDISMIKTDIQGMRADITNIRGEMRDGFAAIDARLRPLEQID